VDGVVAYLALYSCGATEVRKLREDIVDCSPPLMTLKLGIRELAAWEGADNDVTQSSRRLFLQSSKRPKWELKSATTNRPVKFQRSPRLRLRGEAVGADGSTVSLTEVVVYKCPELCDEFAMENTEVRARVYQQPMFACLVRDEEAAGGRLSDVYHR
jgi:hypothetical protein